jgi:uncharacterized protein involved in exopolysaccharide biosynthesis
MNPRPVNFSLRVYQWLLRAYPRSHRDQYGAAMLQLFRDECRDAWREGHAWGLALLWLRIVPDLLKTLALEHLENLKGKKLMPRKLFADVRSSSAAKVAFFIVFPCVFIYVLLTATIVTFILPETYRSTARIRVERHINDVVDGAGHRNMAGAYDPYFIQTEFEVIQSERVLDKVIDTLNLNEAWQKKYNFDRKIKTSDSRAALKRMIELRPSRNTSLMEISVYSEDKLEAAKIANAIAESYQTYCLTRAVTIATKAVHDVEMEMAAQRRKFDAQDDESRIAEIVTQVNKLTGVASLGATQVEIIEHAEPSYAPVRPNKPLNIFLGGVFGVLIGLLAGGVVAFFVSRLQRRNAVAV